MQASLCQGVDLSSALAAGPRKAARRSLGFSDSVRGVKLQAKAPSASQLPR